MNLFSIFDWRHLNFESKIQIEDSSDLNLWLEFLIFFILNLWLESLTWIFDSSVSNFQSLIENTWVFYLNLRFKIQVEDSKFKCFQSLIENSKKSSIETENTWVFDSSQRLEIQVTRIINIFNMFEYSNWKFFLLKYLII